MWLLVTVMHTLQICDFQKSFDFKSHISGFRGLFHKFVDFKSQIVSHKFVDSVSDLKSHI